MAWLRPWFQQQKGWVLATTIGWMLGSALMLLISTVMPFTLMHTVLAGALFGSIRWRVLGRWSDQIYGWILSGTVRMAIASMISGTTMNLFGGTSSVFG